MQQTCVSPNTDKRANWIAIAFSIIAPINVSLAVIDHWARFGLIQKSSAVVLLVLLVEMPFLLFSGNSRVDALLNSRHGLALGYMMLLLATMIFGSHLGSF
jgi:hypothetical protein